MRVVVLISIGIIALSCGSPSAAVAQQRTLTENFRIHQGFRSKFLSKARDVVVWLPPGYDGTKDKRYPVLYMHDGPSVFVNWRIDEIAERLIASKDIEPLIIVGVANGGTEDDRFNEFTPTRAMGKGGNADQYGRMLVEEIKPFIDAEYRTLADPAHTAMGGSSLGGLASLYLGLKSAGTFGKVAVMSPSVWWDNKVIIRNVKSLQSKTPVRIWLDIGTEEGPTGMIKELRDALVTKGWKLDDDLIYFEAKGAKHTEQAWSQRSGQVLKYLFPLTGQQ
jgi:predicted alpha/beta superfamily hydrolase